MQFFFPLFFAEYPIALLCKQGQQSLHHKDRREEEERKKKGRKDVKFMSHSLHKLGHSQLTKHTGPHKQPARPTGNTKSSLNLEPFIALPCQPSSVYSSQNLSH